MTVLDRILATSAAAVVGKPANGHAQPHEAYTPNPALRDNDFQAAPPFPLEVLPPRIRRIVQDCYDYLSYPPDFTAAGILAATALAVGRTTRLRYIGDWYETSCLYLALVAPPGTAKSHPLAFALRPVIEANKAAIREYNRARVALEAAESTAVPVDKQCLFGDFTIESLVKAVEKNKRGVGVYLDELRALFNNFNRYNAGSEVEFWLQNWTGSSIPFSRMQRKFFLEWPAISIVGTIQPSLLEDIGKGGRNQNGFVERVLFCYPDNVPVIPLRKRSERSDTAHIISKNYLPIIQSLLSRDLLLHGNENEDEVPHEAILEPDADDRITDYINALKAKMEAIDNEYTRNVYSKMQTYTLRFALLLHLLEYACKCQDNTDFPPNCDLRITVKQVDRACALTEYFLSHALKANNAINGATPLDKLPRDERNWYKSLPMNEVFSTKLAEEKAVEAKISRAKMFRLLGETDPQKRLFQKVRHGEFERIYF